MNPAHHPTNRSRSTSGNEVARRKSSTNSQQSTQSAAAANNVTAAAAYASVFSATSGAAAPKDASSSSTAMQLASPHPSERRLNGSIGGADDMTDTSTMNGSTSRAQSTEPRLRSSSNNATPAAGNFSFHFNPSAASSARPSVPLVTSSSLHHAPSLPPSSLHTKSTRLREQAPSADQLSRRSSASDRSSFSPTPYSTGVPLKTKRKLRKNNREKQRRSELNDKFDELSDLLRLGNNSGGAKVEKFSVLSEAVVSITSLRKENYELRAERNELRAEISKLSLALNAHAHAAITNTATPAVATAITPKSGFPFATMAAVAAPSVHSPISAFNSAFPFVNLPSQAYAVNPTPNGVANSAFTFNASSSVAATTPGHHGHKRGGIGSAGPLGSMQFGSNGSFGGFSAFASVPALAVKMETNSGSNSLNPTPTHQSRQPSTERYTINNINQSSSNTGSNRRSSSNQFGSFSGNPFPSPQQQQQPQHGRKNSAQLYAAALAVQQQQQQNSQQLSLLQAQQQQQQNHSSPQISHLHDPIISHPHSNSSSARSSFVIGGMNNAPFHSGVLMDDGTNPLVSMPQNILENIGEDTDVNNYFSGNMEDGVQEDNYDPLTSQGPAPYIQHRYS